MVSSFGADHDGEMLVLNYARGNILRIVPDFALVPRAPHLTAEFDGLRMFANWAPDTDGIVVMSYWLEHFRDGSVVSRQSFAETAAEIEGMPGDCVQVRGVARDGASGPPSPRVCFQ
jgi:hypothetical protein